MPVRARLLLARVSTLSGRRTRSEKQYVVLVGENYSQQEPRRSQPEPPRGSRMARPDHMGLPGHRSRGAQVAGDLHSRDSPYKAIVFARSGQIGISRRAIAARSPVSELIFPSAA